MSQEEKLIQAITHRDSDDRSGKNYKILILFLMNKQEIWVYLYAWEICICIYMRGRL